MKATHVSNTVVNRALFVNNFRRCQVFLFITLLQVSSALSVQKNQLITMLMALTIDPRGKYLFMLRGLYTPAFPFQFVIRLNCVGQCVLTQGYWKSNGDNSTETVCIVLGLE